MKYLIILVLVVLILIISCNLNNNPKVEKFQTSTCDPDDADISGETVIDCVRRCGNSDNACLNGQNDIGTLIASAQNFLNTNRNIEINPPSNESDPIFTALQNESTCLQRCLSCGWNNEGGENKCRWSSTNREELNNSYNRFKTNWESKNFVVGAIPEDKKITISWEEKFNLDVWYVENQNFWLDIKIIWMTIKKVIAREGISADD